ncbi:hypothetical protein HK096_005156, partial [Nowakowskiella sp. JEL0078]
SILTFKGGEDPSFQTDTVGGVLISHEDGREEMAFFLAFGSFSTTSILLGHLWIAWGTRGLYIGTRQIYLTAQIDDLFLDTLSPVIPGVVNTTYRINSNDIDNIIAWQIDINNKRLAPGSNFKLEMAFNGYGSLAKASPNLLNIDPKDYVGNNFVKPPGVGDHRWPVPPPTFESLQILDSTLIQKDSLFSYFNNQIIQNNFFFLSHTFTHENLNNASYEDANNEIKYNIQIAKLLNLYNSSQFSQHSLVTPQISGIWNGDLLQALLDNNITTIVGDNSRYIVNTLGNWYPYFTTVASSNLAGFAVLPRSPCEIYFDASTIFENTYLYNTLYSAILGVSTNDQVMEREGDRVVRKLLLLHPDSYQFHQANLRMSSTIVNAGGGSGYFSLVQQWVESVVYKLGLAVNWPVTTLKQDELVMVLLKRNARLSCGVQSMLLYDSTNTKIVGIQVSSSGVCDVPVTVPDTATYPSNSKATKLGLQPLVINLKMEGTTQTVMLGTPIVVISTTTLSSPSSTTSMITTTSTIATTTTTSTSTTTTTISITNTTSSTKTTNITASTTTSTSINIPTTTSTKTTTTTTTTSPAASPSKNFIKNLQ